MLSDNAVRDAQEVVPPFAAANADIGSPPIFVGGAGRSGTTLLRVILDSHSHIACGPELKVIPSIAMLWAEFQTTYAPYLAQSKIGETDIDRAFRVFIASLIASLRRESGKPRIAEKTPNNVFFFRHLHRMFPNASYVHMVRDGRDVVASLLTMDWKGPDGQPLEYTKDARLGARYWANSIVAARQFLMLGVATWALIRFDNPLIWLPVAVVMGAMGMIPAMPQTIFLPAAGLALWLWHSLRKRAQRPAPVVEEIAPAPDPSLIVLDEVSDRTLVTIELGYGLVQLVDERKGAPLVTRITGVRKQLSQAFGFIVPQFRVRDALDMPPHDYRILLGGVTLAGATVRSDRILAIDAGEARSNHTLRGEATRDPSFGCPALWIDPAQRDHAIAEGFLTVDASTVIATHLNQLLSERPQELLGPDEVKTLVEAVKERACSLVETIHPQPLSLAALTRLLRALLEDGISIAHPLPIFSSLSRAVQQTVDHDRLVDLLRADLGALIVGRICPPHERLPVLTLDAGLEGAIVQGMMDPATGQPVIEPDLARMIGERIAQISAERGPTAIPLALVVQPRARRALAALLRMRAPACLVLSITELPASQPIEVIDVIGAPPPQAPGLPHPDSFEEAESMAA